MGTRSLTLVYDDEEILVNMYRQFDGYPSGHGKELFDFLSSGKLVNGLGNEEGLVFNGMKCLAAAVVAHFKTGPGGIYLQPAKSRDCGQDYEYYVHGGFDRRDVTVVVRSYKKKLFEGSLEDFGAWCLHEPE